MNRRRVAVVGVVLMAIAAVATVLVLRDDGRESSLTLYGNVDIREVELAFRVPGRLQEMAFDEGDSVPARTLVARLDDTPYREALAVAEARVQGARAAFAKLQSGYRPREIEQARARLKEAEAAYANASRDLKRQQGLRESGAASQKTLDAAEARHDETSARVAAARDALALLEEGFRDEDVAAAAAELAGAEAERDRARTQLEDTKLFTPNAGIIFTRVREPGSILGAGIPVYTLSLEDPVYVRAYVGEPDLGRLEPGAAVTLTTDSSNTVYEGRIGFISPRAEFTPRSVETPELRTDLVYRLRIVVADPTDGLRQGMPVTVHIPLANAEA